MLHLVCTGALFHTSLPYTMQYLLPPPPGVLTITPPPPPPQECLDREDYTLVLDRACVQFEPDDPDYIRVTSATYDHVDAARLYDRLQNTRHFGALAFYLAWHRRIDNLLLHFIQHEK